MHLSHRIRKRALRTLTLTFAVAFTSTAFADELSWSTLEKLRTTLEKRSPVSASFEQSLVPSGFALEDAEVESGKLAMNLPACLRWDYLGDFEKSFLLCDNLGYYWNPGESVGQIFELEDREDAPGLDFFLRTSAQLRTRYKAKSSVSGEQVTIDLEPLRPTEDVVSMRLVVNKDSGLLQTLSYDDVEGNRTIFKMNSYQDGASATFTPPKGVSWERP